MGYILITNDDGLDSPALRPLIRAVRKLAPVRVVVPEGERSWIGKAITRFSPLRARPLTEGDLEIVAVDGHPADCTNLGVHSLFEEPPEMVVSGVNLGLNTGLGFFLSSGTVGAAMEGWIAGIPALAFSVGVQGSDREWKRDANEPSFAPVWDRAAAISAAVLADVRAAGFPENVDLLSVNFPVEADLDSPRSLTTLARVGYGSLFRSDGDGQFVHDFGGTLRGATPSAGSDVEAVRGGRVSITPVRLTQKAAVADAFRKRVERSGSGG